MIHEAFHKSRVAYRYYKIRYPERNYNEDQSRKHFQQDNYIDKAILKKVIDEIYKEQKEVLK